MQFFSLLVLASSSDYNTRFSGITPENHRTGLLPLTAIRTSLDDLINSNTVIVGHALDNDLKTLRMIHTKCVDTAILFPHKLGPPYRRSLRDL
jgi:RNA exonuclease 1